MNKRNLKKIIMCLAMIIIIVPCMFLFSACFGKAESAYDIAVKNGFVGTEQQWLASLKGKDGSNGSNGSDGKNGENYKINSYQLWLDAKNNGYTGDYTQFLSENFTDFMALDNITAATNKAVMSVCEIDAETRTNTTQTGSGVIYKFENRNGAMIAYIITNYHVCYRQNGKFALAEVVNCADTGDNMFKDYAVTFYGMSNSISAVYVGGSKRYDIAVLRTTLGESEKVKTLVNNGYLAADIREDEVNLAENVIAIGNSAGFGIEATTGVVSKTNDVVAVTLEETSGYFGTTNSVVIEQRLIRFSAFICAGNSGGGLFDIDGNLIGITSSGNEKYQSINYAIPVSTAATLADRIIDECGDNSQTIEKVYIGVQTGIASSYAHRDEVNGYAKIYETMYVADVANGSIANKMGILKNDIIEAVFVNGTQYTIDASYEFPELMLSIKAGDKIKVKVRRGGASTIITLSEYTVSSSDFKNIDNENYFSLNEKTIQERF